MYKWIQNGQTSEMQKLTHTHLQTLRMCGTCVCVRSCHRCSFKKSTSLPRELSAIADLNPHRYLGAASSFWTAVAAVTKQVHFCFSGTNPGASAERSWTILNAYSAGFLQKRDTSRESMSTQSYLRIMLQNRGGVGFYTIIATVNDIFYSFSSLSLVSLGENTLQNSFSHFFHYKYINI